MFHTEISHVELLLYTVAAVTESLESKGTLQQLRANVRAGIFQALEEPQVQHAVM